MLKRPKSVNAEEQVNVKIYGDIKFLYSENKSSIADDNDAYVNIKEMVENLKLKLNLPPVTTNSTIAYNIFQGCILGIISLISLALFLLLILNLRFRFIHIGSSSLWVALPCGLPISILCLPNAYQALKWSYLRFKENRKIKEMSAKIYDQMIINGSFHKGHVIEIQDILFIGSTWTPDYFYRFISRGEYNLKLLHLIKYLIRCN